MIRTKFWKNRESFASLTNNFTLCYIFLFYASLIHGLGGVDYAAVCFHAALRLPAHLEERKRKENEKARKEQAKLKEKKDRELKNQSRKSHRWYISSFVSWVWHTSSVKKFKDHSPAKYSCCVCTWNPHHGSQFWAGTFWGWCGSATRYLLASFTQNLVLLRFCNLFVWPFDLLGPIQIATQSELNFFATIWMCEWVCHIALRVCVLMF